MKEKNECVKPIENEKGNTANEHTAIVGVACLLVHEVAVVWAWFAIASRLGDNRVRARLRACSTRSTASAPVTKRSIAVHICGSCK